MNNITIIMHSINKIRFIGSKKLIEGEEINKRLNMRYENIPIVS